MTFEEEIANLKKKSARIHEVVAKAMVERTYVRGYILPYMGAQEALIDRLHAALVESEKALADVMRAGMDYAENVGERLVGWQDMSTAPTDGTPILAIVEGTPRIVCWASSSFDEPQGWRSVVQIFRGGGCRINNWFNLPTHWMPLPPPPAGEAA